jgi:L-fuconolactonase
VPDTAIIDTHLHIWDPRLIRYPWIEGNDLLDRPYLPGDHADAFSGVDVEAMVFVQCDAEAAAYLDEVDWVAAQAKQEPRIKAIVAFAPLEKGRAVEAELAALKKRPLVRGVRRLLQDEDPEFCLRQDFIEGVRALADFGLSFDICIKHRHMANILRFVEALPEVPMILDHIGKPGIRDGLLQPWATQMRELAQFPSVACKISGVATEARADWTADELKPFIEVAFSEFGFERTMYGGDWPVMLLAIEPMRWIETLDDLLLHASPQQRRSFWRDNAIRTYRLDM